MEKKILIHGSKIKDFPLIRRLVGSKVIQDQLRHVDYAVSEDMGIFMPIAGPCYYAVSPNHTHPSYSFVLAFDDYCRIKFGEKEKKCIHATVCAISPGVAHHEVMSKILSRYAAVFISTTYFEKQLEHYGIDERPFFQGNAFPVKSHLTHLLGDYLNEYEAAVPGYQQLLTASCLKITHSIIRMIYDINVSKQNFMDRLSINKVISFMHSHYSEKLTVTDLSRIAAISTSHFTRLFKKETGCTPVVYLQHLRLEMAKRMLRTGKERLTEIAYKCGFNSSSYFSACFVQHFNMTPSEFRKSFSIDSLP